MTVSLFNKIDWKKVFDPPAAYPMSTLGRLKKWLFGNIQFHL
jgi:hypothetical protein